MSLVQIFKNNVSLCSWFVNRALFEAWTCRVKLLGFICHYLQLEIH